MALCAEDTGGVQMSDVKDVKDELDCGDVVKRLFPPVKLLPVCPPTDPGLGPDSLILKMNAVQEYCC